jgi:hypothetical protein
MLGKIMVGMWLSIICVVASTIGWSLSGNADQFGKEIMRLPRSFHDVRLGMTWHELSRVAPGAKRTSAGDTEQASRTIVVATKQDPYISRIEYRLFREALQDLAIYYKTDRIPRGYASLLDKMKVSYGEPVVQDISEYDPRGNVFSVKKTVWKDDATVIVLSEVGRLVNGEEVYDLVVTLTDRALQNASQREEEERRRQAELAVPVPLKAPHHTSRDSAELPSARSQNVSNS